LYCHGNDVADRTVGYSQQARKFSLVPLVRTELKSPQNRKSLSPIGLSSILILVAALLLLSTSSQVQAAGTGLIFQASFISDAIGLYTTAEMNRDFQKPLWADGVTNGLASVTYNPAGGTGKVLRILYPQGKVSYGVIINVPLHAQYDALYFSYDVYFPANFNFVLAGKMSGLCGGKCNAGGQKPNGTDGWSSRVVWRSGGTANQYLYDPNQVGTYGDIMSWKYNQTQWTFSTGRWHHVESFVQMNTVGMSNGVVKSWLDGHLAYENDQLVFRTVSTLNIDTFLFETFFGGNTSNYAPPANEYAYFDNVQVSTAQ